MGDKRWLFLALIVIFFGCSGPSSETSETDLENKVDDNQAANNGSCGDQVCNNGETNLTCTADCPASSPVSSTPQPVLQPVPPHARCGDRMCSHGETNQSCAVDCPPASPPPAPRCGDHQVHMGEQCDDGNQVNGDGCSANCQFEIVAGRDELVTLGRLPDIPAECAEGSLCHWDALAVSPDGTRIAAAYRHEVQRNVIGGLMSWTRNAQGQWAFSWNTGSGANPIHVWSEGCDFHPTLARIYCAHQPLPDLSRTELLVFNATNGQLLNRVSVLTNNQNAQDEPYFGDSARVSPDGNWVAMTQGVNADGELSQVIVFATNDVANAVTRSTINVAFPDEVVFGQDSRSLYASLFTTSRVKRMTLGQDARWVDGGNLDVRWSVAGIDVDGFNRVIVNRWSHPDGRVIIITPSQNWVASAFESVPNMGGTSYDLCADARLNVGNRAWAVSQDGQAQAINTETGIILGVGQINPVNGNGIGMSCARQTGKPFIISEGTLWTWE